MVQLPYGDRNYRAGVLRFPHDSFAIIRTLNRTIPVRRPYWHREIYVHRRKKLQILETAVRFQNRAISLISYGAKNRTGYVTVTLVLVNWVWDAYTS